MATHSGVLAWRIPGMGEPGGLPSLGSHRIGHDQKARELQKNIYFCFKDTIAVMMTITTTTTKSLQSCPTLCDPVDGSPPGSPIPGILQARALEWVAISPMCESEKGK